MAIQSFQKYTPMLGQAVYVDPMARVIGQVELGDDASIWPFVSIRGDLLAIKIGARTNIQDNSVLHTTQKSEFHPEGFALTLGDDVTVGHNVILHGCTIGNFCLIGMGSIILDGVVIQDEVFVAAGSLVPPGKVLESGWLWRGNPAKPARLLTADEKRFFRFSSAGYVELKNKYLNDNNQ